LRLTWGGGAFGSDLTISLLQWCAWQQHQTCKQGRSSSSSSSRRRTHATSISAATAGSSRGRGSQSCSKGGHLPSRQLLWVYANQVVASCCVCISQVVAGHKDGIPSSWQPGGHSPSPCMVRLVGCLCLCPWGIGICYMECWAGCDCKNGKCAQKGGREGRQCGWASGLAVA
jgi:hypothetical protein